MTISSNILDNDTLKRIATEIPELKGLNKLVLSLDPNIISVGFHPDSNIPIASICLRDTLDVLHETQYTLHESLTNKIWYQEICKPPQEFSATFISRIYLDDTAIRLYSAGEHMAFAIQYMLEISKDQLKDYAKKRISQQSSIGHFMKNELATHSVTRLVEKLITSNDWNKSIQYRNTLIHEQPPTVQGLGLIYRRKNRWTKDTSGKTYYRLGIGGSGDKPEYTIDDLFKFIQPALLLFIEVLESIIHYYIKLINQRGITISQNKCKITQSFKVKR